MAIINWFLENLSKVLLLERRVAELEKESEASVEQHARLRQDNLHLVHRANALEEQLKEQEVQADEQLQQESRRQKEATIKLEREREMELENLHTRWAPKDGMCSLNAVCRTVILTKKNTKLSLRYWTLLTCLFFFTSASVLPPRGTTLSLHLGCPFIQLYLSV